MGSFVLMQYNTRSKVAGNKGP